MKIKICGITSVEVAQKTCALSPDALGVYVQESMGKNFISPDIAKDIAALGNSLGIEVFFLSTSENTDEIIDWCKYIKPSHLQLTSDLSLEEIIKIRENISDIKLVKVVSVIGEDAVGQAKSYDNSDFVDQILLDSKVGNLRGGTGKTHDWNISAEIVRQVAKPVWLAGGINPNNIQEAMDTVQPYGIDLETGAQNPDGSKNFENIKKLIHAAHSV
jgi:phosphoribosylanthranilate isomerase